MNSQVYHHMSSQQREIVYHSLMTCVGLRRDGLSWLRQYDRVLPEHGVAWQGQGRSDLRFDREFCSDEDSVF